MFMIQSSQYLATSLAIILLANSKLRKRTCCDVPYFNFSFQLLFSTFGSLIYTESFLSIKRRLAKPKINFSREAGELTNEELHTQTLASNFVVTIEGKAFVLNKCYSKNQVLAPSVALYNPSRSISSHEQSCGRVTCTDAAPRSTDCIPATASGRAPTRSS